MNTILLTALLSIGNAQAGEHEISFESGTIGLASENSFVLSEYRTSITSGGLSYGYGLTENITVFGSWHRGSLGSSLVTPRADEMYWEGDYGLHAALVLDEIALGGRYRWDLSPGWKPSATAQALMLYGRYKMDDDIEVDGNENELMYHAASPGLALTGGIEWVPLRGRKAFDVVLGLDVGYAAALPLKYADKSAHDDTPAPIGDIKVNGIFSRLILGARF